MGSHSRRSDRARPPRKQGGTGAGLSGRESVPGTPAETRFPSVRGRARTSRVSRLAMLGALSLFLAAGRSGGEGAKPPAPRPAYQVGGVTMVPLVPIVQWLGAEYRRLGDTLTVTRSGGGAPRTLVLRVGSAAATSNGKQIRLARKVHSARGEIYVPLDLLSAGLGLRGKQIPGRSSVRLRDGNRERILPVMAPRYPIVVPGGDYLLGGLDNGRWLDADHMAPLLRGGERYWAYSLARYLGTATGSRPKEEEPGAYHHVELSPPPPEVAPSVTSGAPPLAMGMPWNAVVALGGPWDAAPRKPAVLGTTSTAYQEAVREVLREHGLPQAGVRLIQVLRIDLEGDGEDEVLITAQAPGLDRPMPSISANDYSLVMLRKIAGGKVRTFLLEAGFYPAARDPAAPYVYRVDGLLDLDGDGVLEILVANEYYEGMGMAVYQLRGRQPRKVLDGGFGA